MIWYVLLGALVGFFIAVICYMEVWDSGWCWLGGLTYGVAWTVGFILQWPDFFKI